MPDGRPIDQPGPLDLRNSLIQQVLERISGIRVGRVISYDPVARTCEAQPVRRRRIFGKPTAPPVLSKVPCGWWRFGSMVLAGELEAGDTVLLVTLERELWPWYALGQDHDPQAERMHHATDTLALPWISALTRAITARLPRTFYMGREDGSAGITIPMDVPARLVVDAGPGGVVLGATAVNSLMMYPPFAAAFAAWASAMAGAGAAAAGVPPGTPDPTGVLYTAYIASVTTATATLATALATAPAVATIKTVAE